MNRESFEVQANAEAKTDVALNELVDDGINRTIDILKKEELPVTPDNVTTALFIVLEVDKLPHAETIGFLAFCAGAYIRQRAQQRINEREQKIVH